MTEKKQSESIIDELVHWLNGAQEYSVPSLGFYSTVTVPHHREVQQHLDELKTYLEVLEGLDPRHVTLEIGLYRGGTHFVWTRLFEEVISIDNDYWTCCKAIVEFPTPKSKVLYGNSTEAVTSQAVEAIVDRRQVDHLFIDGAHDYKSVLSDFVVYSKFVRHGGIIGFHDSYWPGGEVMYFLQDLKIGHVPGWPPIETLQEINYHAGASALGISYFYKE